MPHVRRHKRQKASVFKQSLKRHLKSANVSHLPSLRYVKEVREKADIADELGKFNERDAFQEIADELENMNINLPEAMRRVRNMESEY